MIPGASEATVLRPGTTAVWAAAKRDDLLAAWVASVLGSYPQQTARFLRDRRDPFRNPVGHVVREGLTALVAELLGDFDAGRVREALDGMVRLRAVQDFTPADAVAFVADGKRLVRGALGDTIAGDGGEAHLAVLDRRIDEAASIASALYTSCREEMAAIKTGEARRRSFVRDRIEALEKARCRKDST
jgi:hypothetical protein